MRFTQENKDFMYLCNPPGPWFYCLFGDSKSRISRFKFSKFPIVVPPKPQNLELGVPATHPSKPRPTTNPPKQGTRQTNQPCLNLTRLTCLRLASGPAQTPKQGPARAPGLITVALNRAPPPPPPSPADFVRRPVILQKASPLPVGPGVFRLGPRL